MPDSLSGRSALLGQLLVFKDYRNSWEFALPGPQTVDGYTNPDNNVFIHSHQQLMPLSYRHKGNLQDAAVD